MTTPERYTPGYGERSKGPYNDILDKSGWRELPIPERVAGYSTIGAFVIEDASRLEDVELLIMSHGIFEDEEARQWAQSNLDPVAAEQYSTLVSPEMIAAQSGQWEGSESWLFGLFGGEGKKWVEGSVGHADQTLLTMAIRKDPHWSDRYVDTTMAAGAAITGAIVAGSVGLPLAARGAQIVGRTRGGQILGTGLRGLGSAWSSKPVTGIRWGTFALASAGQITSILANTYDPEGMEAAELVAQLEREAKEEGVDVQASGVAPYRAGFEPKVGDLGPVGVAGPGVQALPTGTQSAIDSFGDLAQEAPTRGATTASDDLSLEASVNAALAEDPEQTGWRAPTPVGGSYVPHQKFYSSAEARAERARYAGGEWQPSSPIYTEASLNTILGGWTPMEIEKFQSFAIRAGIIDPEATVNGSQFQPGYRDFQTREALGFALTEANAETETYWQTMRRLAQAGDEAAEEVTPRDPFPRGTYVAPDYAELSNSVVANIEQRLGRPANSSEITLLANQMAADNREDWEQKEGQRYADWVDEGRAVEEGDEAFGGGELEEISYKARFEKMFQEKYGDELDRVDRLDTVASQTQNMMAGINRLSQSMRG